MQLRRLVVLEGGEYDLHVEVAAGEGKAGIDYSTSTNIRTLIHNILVIAGTSGSGPFNAGVGATQPASRGQFWPLEKNRKWPEVGIRIFYHFFSKIVFNFIILINDMYFEAPGNYFFLSNSHD